jgi:hypothetical protein
MDCLLNFAQPLDPRRPAIELSDYVAEFSGYRKLER